MMSPLLSAMPLRFARLNFSLFVLALATMLLPGTGRAQTISPGGAINFTASDSSAQSSTVTVSGAPGPVATVQVELQGVHSNGTGNFDSMVYAEFMLQSPTGAQFVLLGQTGDGIDNGGLNGQNIIIVNSGTPAPNSISVDTPWGTGSPQTVEPGSYYFSNGDGPPPLPTAENTSDYPQTDGSATLNGKFNGVAANGTWTLYLIDNDAPVDPVSITGWTLTLTYGTATATTTVLSSSAGNPAFYANSASSVSTTFTATLTPSAATGTVTFQANGSTICSAVAVSGGAAHCTTSLAQGNNAIVANYTPTGSYGQSGASMNQLVEVTPANPSGDQWCNNSLVSVPTNDNPGLAYPSVIKIPSTAYPGKTVANVEVELEGVQGLSEGIGGQYLLVAPGGGAKNLLFFQQGFENTSASSAVNLTFEDSAGQTVPYDTGTPTSGTYLPTDNSNEVNPDTMPSSTSSSVDSSIPQVPGTLNFAPPYGGDTTVYAHTNILTFGEAFNGAPADGAWALYSVAPGAVNLNSGWCITLSLNTGTSTTTVVTSTQNPQTTGQSVTITATVTAGGNPVTSGGTVTFTDTTGSTPVTLASNVTLNGSGQASFSTSALTQGDHEITANYSGTSSDNASFGALWQRINTATTTTNVNSNTWQYCNPGAVQIQGGTAAGPFTPNPSVISVANLPGTLNTVGVQLTNFSVSATYGLEELASLVESPTGAALDFFSNTTQGANGNATASSGNYIFEDSAGGLVSSGNTNISPGPYKPTAYTDYLGNPDVFTSSPSGYNVPTFSYAPSHGSSTFASVFNNGSNANGAWALFFSSGFPNATFGAAGGWCVNLTENLPSVTADASHNGGSFTQGQQNAQLAVVVTNNGPGSTGDPTGSSPMTVIDTLNSAFTYASGTGSGWSCGAAGQTVTCTNHSAISDGSSYPTLTIDVNVAGGATGPINNSFTASGAGVASTGSNTDSITIQPAPVLAVSKTHPGTFTQGQTAEWDISVSNTASGSTTSGTVTVSDTLPSGYSVVNFGSTSVSWSCAGAGSSALSCTSTSAISGGSSFPQIQVIVNVPANSPVTVSNTAQSWGGGDLIHTNSGNAAVGSDNNVTVVQVPAFLANSGGGTQSTTVSTAFAAPLSVTVEDARGTPVPGVTVTFTAPASGASGTFSNSSNTITATTNASGIASESFTANSVAGGYSVSAAAASLAPASFSLTNNAGAATHFSVSAPGTAFAGSGFNITVTALDAFGNTATGYLGTVHFSSSDAGPGRLIPANFTFGAGNAGTITIPVTLVTAGLQSITATDTVTGSITGSATVSVSPGPAVITNVTAPSAVYAGAPFNFTVTAYDCCGNVATSYGGTVAFSSSDAAASLPASYTFLAGDAGSHTFSAAFNTVGTQTITATDSVNLLIATSSGTTVTIPNLVVTTAADDAGAAGNCNVQTTPGTGTDPSCSLRDALLQAGTLGSGSITFDGTAFGSAQSILLTNGTLNIPSITTITGPTTGSGSTLTNLVTVNGNATSTVFTTNSSIAGAAIANLAITNGSDSAGTGAGISNGYQASLTITNSTISGNTSTNGAGAIFNDYGATLTVTGSTLSGNSGAVGGIIDEPGGIVTVTSSTLSGNSAGNGGGGIAMGGGTVTVINSTISGNYAVNGGGGIGNSGGTVNLANSIVDGNWLGTASTVNVYDDFDDTTGNTTYTGAGGNVLGYYNNPQAAAPTPTVNLAPLGNYGGPTQTMLPLPSSPAICSGTTNNVGSLSGDQRGFGFDPNCPAGSGTVDSGAVQTNYVLSFTTEPPSSPALVTLGAAISPSPVVSLTENGVAAAAATSSISMTDSAALLGGTTSANLAGGSATFSNLILTAPTSSDTLTATLALNSSLNLTASSTSFATSGQAQSISFPAIGGLQVATTTLGLSATASSGLTVAFASTTPSTCTVSGTTASLLAAGNCTIQATQAGDGTYAAAAMVSQSFIVHHQGQNIEFPPITGTQYALTQLPLTATASSGLTVTFASITPANCTVSSSTVSLLSQGNCVIHATQAGDAAYSLAPTVSQDIPVHRNTQLISFPAINSTQYAVTTLTLPATASSGLAVVYNSTTPAVCTVSGSTASLLISGTCNILASQPGNGAYFAAPSISQSFTVHHQTQSINFPPIASQVIGANVTLSATASSGLTVSFASVTPAVCTVTGTTASVSATGNCIIYATQAGNATYSLAPTVSQYFTVTAH